jgi:hypothetical protein
MSDLTDHQPDAFDIALREALKAEFAKIAVPVQSATPPIGQTGVGIAVGNPTAPVLDQPAVLALPKPRRRRRKKRPHGGRKPIANPSPEGLRKRAYRARKKVEAEAAEKAARKTKNAERWLDFKRKHPNWKPKAYRKPTVTEKKLAPYLNEWYAPDLSYEESLAFVKAEVVPQQPQVAGNIVDAVQRDCHRYNLCRNRFTLRRGGIQAARVVRNLILQAWDDADANPDVSLAVAIRIAATQTQADLPADVNWAKRINDDAQQNLAQGAALLRVALGESTAEWSAAVFRCC